MTNDPDDYSAFVAALPGRFEAQLVNGDNVSTAFYECRRAGWDRDALIGDAQYALRNGGVGLVVARLRTLSTQRPLTDRPSPARAMAYVAKPQAYLPPSMASERMRFIFDLAGSGLTADEAEEGMRGLIRDQRARLAQ